jgi:hypothetical protein
MQQTMNGGTTAKFSIVGVRGEDEDVHFLII